MGIALAGHRNRNEMGCFIAGLNPKGAASSQNLKVGDEILEVTNIYNFIHIQKIHKWNAFVYIKADGFCSFARSIFTYRLMEWSYIKCAI